MSTQDGVKQLYTPSVTVCPSVQIMTQHTSHTSASCTHAGDKSVNQPTRSNLALYQDMCWGNNCTTQSVCQLCCGWVLVQTRNCGKPLANIYNRFVTPLHILPFLVLNDGWSVYKAKKIVIIKLQTMCSGWYNTKGLKDFFQHAVINVA